MLQGTKSLSLPQLRHKTPFKTFSTTNKVFIAVPQSGTQLSGEAECISHSFLASAELARFNSSCFQTSTKAAAQPRQDGTSGGLWSSPLQKGSSFTVRLCCSGFVMLSFYISKDRDSHSHHLTTATEKKKLHGRQNYRKKGWLQQEEARPHKEEGGAESGPRSGGLVSEAQLFPHCSTWVSS